MATILSLSLSLLYHLTRNLLELKIIFGDRWFYRRRLPISFCFFFWCKIVTRSIDRLVCFALANLHFSFHVWWAFEVLIPIKSELIITLMFFSDVDWVYINIPPFTTNINPVYFWAGFSLSVVSSDPFSTGVKLTLLKLFLSIWVMYPVWKEWWRCWFMLIVVWGI